MDTKETVLVVDDDREIVGAIALALEKEGYRVLRAYDGMEALDHALDPELRLILMDVMMPRLDGLSAVLRIRERRNLPIIVLSAKSEESDKVLGLSMGADDYVTKPFSLAVLLAKTEALIRRSRGGGAETLACGAITLEPGRRACTVGGRLVALPPREYELLLCLMRNKGQVLRREQLLDKVWGIDFEGGDRAVDGRIKVLRAALGPAGKQIRTVFKVGYKLEGEQHGAD